MGNLRTSLLFLIISLAVSATVTYQYVRIPAKLADGDLYEKQGFIRDHKSHPDYVFGYLPHSKLNLAIKAKYQVLSLDEARLRRMDFDPVTLQERASGVGDETYEAYHTYASLTTELESLAATYPHLARLDSAGKSVQNRELWLLRLSNFDGPSGSRPKLLYISSMHGDEVTGKEMMIYFIRYLLKGYGTDPRATALLDSAEVYIMPSMNPDGTELEQRFNANGVDLNRNFPKLSDAEFSLVGREPETLALMDLHKRNHFLVAMNFHGGEICVNIPWDSKPNSNSEELFGDNDVMLSLAREYASHNRPLYDNHQGNFDHGVTYGFEWFQILGGMQDWASFFRQSIHATLEISVNKWPGAPQLPQFWRDNQESILSYLENALVGVHLKVTDAAGNGVPVVVTVDSSKRSLKYSNGIVHRTTLPSKQRVTLSATGFKPVTLDWNPKKFDGNLEPVVLTP